jgi:arginine utilization protein RocB
VIKKVKLLKGVIVMKWQTKEQLKDLLATLVSVPSISETPGEIAIAESIEHQLSSLNYFQRNKDHLTLHPTPDGRKLVTAFVKQKDATKTVILVSHFDVVDVEDYGNFKHLAFQMDALTEAMEEKKHNFAKTVQDDMEDDQEEWLFGRGSMDMKAGIALQMAMVERATHGEFDGNILLVSVPDEEVNSVGMLTAVPILKQMKERYNLNYTACLNAEPMFKNHPQDTTKYIYTGSVGKLLPSFFCLGAETHVGEPFSGLNSNFMVSQITNYFELNTDFCEFVDGEMTPPPTNLIQKDFKENYSVQTPHSSVTMINLIYMKRKLNEITEKLLSAVKDVAHSIEDHYAQRANTVLTNPKNVKVNVFTYDELLSYAIELHGKEEIERRQNYLITNRGNDGDRDFSAKLVQDLAFLCKDKAPMIVMFYSPPFYPAVSSMEDEFIQSVADQTVANFKETYNVDVVKQNYFPGLSDLSFVQLNETDEDIRQVTNNTPLFNKGYSLPVTDIKALNIPVINIGPFGRDPHQRTERLETIYSFEKLPEVLVQSIRLLLK